MPGALAWAWEAFYTKYRLCDFLLDVVYRSCDISLHQPTDGADMTIPATIHDEPRIYSNGAAHVPADHLTRTGPHITTATRFEDDFYARQSGFLDAPEFIAAGSAVGSTTPNNPGHAVTTVVYRP